MKNHIIILGIVALISSGLLCGCMTAGQHMKQLGSTQERELTVGTVQKKIRVGMSQADVAEALGSPNIVTKDSTGKETWIYDKIATEASYSKDSGGAWLILGTYGKEAGAAGTTQKTLTVIIKFNEKGLVDSFTYHTSKF